MNSDVSSAQSCIQAALQALKRGDRQAARHYAQRAAALAPQMEQPWLMLAYLASPRAAQHFLEQALKANPSSQQVLAAREWLQKHPASSVPVAKSNQAEALPAAALPQPRKQARRRARLWPWLAGLLVLLAGVVILGSAALPFGSLDHALSWVFQATPTPESSPTAGITRTFTPAWTPTPEFTRTDPATPIPTSTASPIPTSTASPIPTATATLIPTGTSTATPFPTEPSTATPVPTAVPTTTPLPSPTQVKTTYYTVVPGDTLIAISQRFNVSVQSLVSANNLGDSTLIMVGQVLLIPGAGPLPAASQPTAASLPAARTGKGKEILVDISEQHMYAYQDGKLVLSFVVSTGTGNSTRIGVFKVLDKIPRAYSSRFNIWMPYWMGIYYSGTLENGIHGLPLLMNGVELWGSLLGQPATYGCVESKTSEAKLLFDWAEIGTPVFIQR